MSVRGWTATACGRCGEVSIPAQGWYTTKFCSIRCANAHSNEPTTCTCGPDAAPDGLGECANCHRLVLSHSWHLGRPQPEQATAA